MTRRQPHRPVVPDRGVSVEGHDALSTTAGIIGARYFTRLDKARSRSTI